MLASLAIRQRDETIQVGQLVADDLRASHDVGLGEQAVLGPADLAPAEVVRREMTNPWRESVPNRRRRPGHDSFLDVVAKLAWHFNPKWDIALGWRRVDDELEIEDVRNDFERRGVMFHVGYSF